MTLFMRSGTSHHAGKRQSYWLWSRGRAQTLAPNGSKICGGEWKPSKISIPWQMSGTRMSCSFFFCDGNLQTVNPLKSKKAAPQSSAKELILLARLRLWPFHLIGTHWHFSSTEEDREVVPVAGVRRFSQSATQKDLFLVAEMLPNISTQGFVQTILDASCMHFRLRLRNLYCITTKNGLPQFRGYCSRISIVSSARKNMRVNGLFWKTGRQFSIDSVAVAWGVFFLACLSSWQATGVQTGE